MNIRNALLLLLIVAAAVCAFPLFHMVFASVTSNQDRTPSSESLIPLLINQSSSLVLTWPIHGSNDDRTAMSQGFAFYKFIRSRDPYHTGLDLVHEGATTAVFSAAAGEIVKIQENDVNCGKKSGCFDHGMGNTVIVRHSLSNATLYTQYSHLDSIPNNLIASCGSSPVDNGKRGRHTCSSPVPVTMNTEIGKVGQSGQGDPSYWDTPHLHFELKENAFIGASPNSDDVGQWGYTSAHPSGSGLRDPIPHLHAAADLSPPQLTEIISNTVLKYGPGGSGINQYRNFNLQLTVGQQYEVLRSALGITTPTCSSGLWYEVRPLSGAVFKVGGSRQVSSGWVCSDAVTGVTPPATVTVDALLDGQPWVGLIDFTIVGPNTVQFCPPGGCTVPTITTNLAPGQYTFSYKGGGPPNASGPTVLPSATQTLSTGGSITFTMSFASPSPSPSPFPSPSPSPPPANTIELLAYQASGYRYQVLNTGTPPPAGFEEPSFDDTSWNVGATAFGFGVGFCPLQATTRTTWPVSTDLLVRRSVDIPAGTSNVRVKVSVDNDIVNLFFNGVAIASDVQHSDCPVLDNFQFDVPQSLVQAGQNTVVYHLRDRGFESFFDTRILGDQSTLNSSWIEKFPTANPTARQGPGMAYDAARQEMVLFGGVIDTATGGMFVNDTWVWNGTSWIQRFPSVSPPPMKFHSMVYDAARQEVVLFGGSGNGLTFNDTWIWDGNNWIHKNPVNSPMARDGAAVVYDSIRQEVVLFGGSSSGAALADTWIWNGTNWLQKSPPVTPQARFFAGLSFDALNGKAVLFGGNGNSSVLGDTWLWDGSSWMQTTPLQSPQPRYSPSMSYDALRNLVVLFGGALSNNITTGETWIWNGSNWSQQFPTISPSARIFAGTGYDAARGQILLFGGDSDAFTHVFLHDTWVWSPGALLAPTLFFDGADNPALTGITFGEPVIDSQGRLVIIGSRPVSCDFDVCSNLYSISPNGALLWSKSAVASSSLADRSLIVGPEDRVYFFDRGTSIFAFDVGGNPVPGWPVSLPFRVGTSSKPIVVDHVDGAVYARTGVTVSFTGFPVAVTALNPNGTQKWERLYPDGNVGGVNLVQRPARDLYTAVAGVGLVALDHGNGNQLCTSPDAGRLVGSLDGVFFANIRSVSSRCKL